MYRSKGWATLFVVASLSLWSAPLIGQQRSAAVARLIETAKLADMAFKKHLARPQVHLVSYQIGRFNYTSSTTGVGYTSYKIGDYTYTSSTDGTSLTSYRIGPYLYTSGQLGQQRLRNQNTMFLFRDIRRKSWQRKRKGSSELSGTLLSPPIHAVQQW